MHAIDDLIDLTAKLFMRRPPAERRLRDSEVDASFESLFAQMRVFEARLIALMFLFSVANVVFVTVLLWIFFRP